MSFNKKLNLGSGHRNQCKKEIYNPIGQFLTFF